MRAGYMNLLIFSPRRYPDRCNTVGISPRAIFHMTIYQTKDKA